MTQVLYRYQQDAPIALLGGAYGNLPGLRACLADAASQGAGLRIFLGDATGCCGHSDEALTLLRDSCEVFIAGNHEIQAAAGELACGCGYGEAVDEQLSCDAHAYAMHSLSEVQRQWIGSWPETGWVETPHGRLLLCHGSPDLNHEFLYESQLSDARLEGWLDRDEAVLMACTHTGLPWVRYLPAGRVAVNVGAVGKPDHDGDAAVHYALLRWVRGFARLEIRRVVYDHAAWADQLAQEGVAAVYLSPLRTGWWTVGEASLPPTERARRPAIGVPDAVTDFYAKVARGEDALGRSSSACCEAPRPDSQSLGYAASDLSALPAEADMGLGCGSPVDAAALQLGEIVLDLGSGGGLDCMLAARAVGQGGWVIGVDATPNMVVRAKANVVAAGVDNAEIRLGTIEHLPVADRSVDVVISNCVINLSRDKARVLREAFRVLRPGGRLVISDTVSLTELPDAVRQDERMQACCVAGAASIATYQQLLEAAGFAEITIDIHENSRTIVGNWIPGSGAEDMVAAASIRARRARLAD